MQDYSTSLVLTCLRCYIDSAMELPFTPYFFKKLAVYQRLKELDEEGKDLWEDEKKVLLWTVGPEHQFPGGAITANHIQPITGRDREVSQRVLEGLEVHGFVEQRSQDENLRISQEGLLAGRVLKETNGLTKRQKYEDWIKNWWVLFWVGVFLVIFQTALVVLNFLLKFMGK